jgi:folate-binding protein YgfZ
VAGPPLLFDLGARGAIVLTGKDRASFLHGLVTNDIVRLTPGTGCAAAFLTPKGRMLADCVVLCEEDRVEIDCDPELARKIEDLLRKYLVFNDVQIVNETAEGTVFHLTGEAAGDAVEDSLRRGIGLGDGSRLPQGLHAHLAVEFPGAAIGGAIRIVHENRTGIPGYDVRFPSSLSEEIRAAFLSAGAAPSTLDSLDAQRIAAGIPRWGFELTEEVLPDEAGLREKGFISENKGCYVGQETVARIKTYGHVNRRLVRLSISGGVPAPGDAVCFGGEKTGTLTSVVSAAGGAAALAFVKRERAEPGTALSIASSSVPAELAATVSSVPLA